MRSSALRRRITRLFPIITHMNEGRFHFKAKLLTIPNTSHMKSSHLQHGVMDVTNVQVGANVLMSQEELADFKDKAIIKQ